MVALILCDMSAGEFDEWLDTEQQLSDARMASLRALAQLAKALGSSLDYVQTLADRLRTCSSEEMDRFRVSTEQVLGIMGIAKPETIAVDAARLPSSSLAQEGTEDVEHIGGPWLQRVTREELDQITTTDHALCHIKEAVSELVDLAGLDPEYHNTDLCGAMLGRLGEQELTALEVTDDYLEELLRVSLDYPKKIPMSAQIVNGICFLGTLKGVPLDYILPYRALSWPAGRWRGPSEGNINSSRYTIETYIQNARIDALHKARLAEWAQTQRSFNEIVSHMDTPEDRPLKQLLIKSFSELLSLDSSREAALEALLNPWNSEETSQEMRIVIYQINHALLAIPSESGDILDTIPTGSRAEMAVRRLLGRKKDEFGKLKLHPLERLHEQNTNMSDKDKEDLVADICSYFSKMYTVLVTGQAYVEHD